MLQPSAALRQGEETLATGEVASQIHRGRVGFLPQHNPGTFVGFFNNVFEIVARVSRIPNLRFVITVTCFAQKVRNRISSDRLNANHYRGRELDPANLAQSSFALKRIRAFSGKSRKPLGIESFKV